MNTRTYRLRKPLIFAFRLNDLYREEAATHMTVEARAGKPSELDKIAARDFHKLIDRREHPSVTSDDLHAYDVVEGMKNAYREGYLRAETFLDAKELSLIRDDGVRIDPKAMERGVTKFMGT